MTGSVFGTDPRWATTPSVLLFQCRWTVGPPLIEVFASTFRVILLGSFRKQALDQFRVVRVRADRRPIFRPKDHPEATALERLLGRHPQLLGSRRKVNRPHLESRGIAAQSPVTQPSGTVRSASQPPMIRGFDDQI